MKGRQAARRNSSIPTGQDWAANIGVDIQCKTQEPGTVTGNRGRNRRQGTENRAERRTRQKKDNSEWRRENRGQRTKSSEQRTRAKITVSGEERTEDREQR